MVKNIKVNAYSMYTVFGYPIFFVVLDGRRIKVKHYIIISTVKNTGILLTRKIKAGLKTSFTLSSIKKYH